jgi:ferric-dicitrate binding protein FerR (iron transport regulator)
MKKNTLDAMLFRFFLGETTAEENDTISAWIKKDPARNQKKLDEAHDLWVLMTMSLPESTEQPVGRGAVGPLNRPKILRWAAGIAASLLLVAGAGLVMQQRNYTALTRQTSVVMTPAGQRVDYRLPDGSNVTLNAGARVEFPVVFTHGERRVKLTGEAMFDVAPDAKNPFIVETFACEVTALGTQFNVIANENNDEFSATLLEGKIAVNRLGNEKKIILEPDMIACLRDGLLVTSRIDSRDDYLWPEGIISIGGLPFGKLVDKLENAYGVHIVLERPTPPVINYGGLKLRVSDGIDHAMKILSMSSDFTYEYDTTENIVTIK